MAMKLVVDQLVVHRGACPVVDRVSFSVGPGEVVGLVGPNGAGKTTLMRAVLGLLPHTGHSSLAALSPRNRARAAAWLPQTRQIAWPVSVETLVALGRVPHLPRGAQLTASDQAAVDNALDRMGLDSYRSRDATQLSGGEQARVLIARTLAQDTPLLMADEPIAGLDPAAQMATMKVFQALSDEGRGVIVSLHDLGLAARHCTRLVVLHAGQVQADAPPRDALSPEILARVFGIRAHFDQTDDGPVFQPVEVLP